MTRRNLFVTLFLVVIAIAAYGYFFVYHKAHADIFEAKPDFNVDAKELYEAFREDELAANDLYLGKIIRLNGSVLDVEVENGTVGGIRLDAGELLDGVVCEMDKIYIRESGEINPGDEVVLQGVCTGFLEDVILNRCVIIEVN